MGRPLKKYTHVKVGSVDYLVLTWDEVEDLVLKICDAIRSEVSRRLEASIWDIKEDTLIVGVKRWGDNVANYLSDAFAIREVRSLGIRSYDQNFKRTLPMLYQGLGSRENLSHFKLVILADGIADSGKTLLFAADFLKRLGAREILSTTLLAKNHAQVYPDVCGRTVHGKYWVAFPWEKAEISRKVVADLRGLNCSDREIFNVLKRRFGYDRRIIKAALGPS